MQSIPLTTVATVILILALTWGVLGQVNVSKAADREQGGVAGIVQQLEKILDPSLKQPTPTVNRNSNKNQLLINSGAAQLPTPTTFTPISVVTVTYLATTSVIVVETKVPSNLHNDKQRGSQGSDESEGKKHSKKRLDSSEDDDSEDDDPGSLLMKKDPVGTHLMIVVGLITTSLNLASCSYLIYLVIKLSKKVGFHSSLRMLFYSVVFDILVGFFFTLSIVYSSLFSMLIGGTTCTVIGFIINTLTASDMLLIAYLALNLLTVTLFGYELPRGKHDWLLLAVVVGLPLLCSIVLANYHAFGPEILWCLIDDDTPAGKFSTISTVVLYFLVGIVICMSYFIVKWKLKTHTGSVENILKFNQDDNEATNKDQYLNKSCIGKVELDELSRSDEYIKLQQSVTLKPTYPTNNSDQFYRRSVIVPQYTQVKLVTHMYIHFFQYTPPAIHLLMMTLDYQSAWIFTLAILSTNLGGIFQLYSYLHHQKKKKSTFKQYYTVDVEDRDTGLGLNPKYER